MFRQQLHRHRYLFDTQPYGVEQVPQRVFILIRNCVCIQDRERLVNFVLCGCGIVIEMTLVENVVKVEDLAFLLGIIWIMIISVEIEIDIRLNIPS